MNKKTCEAETQILYLQSKEMTRIYQCPLYVHFLQIYKYRENY